MTIKQAINLASSKIGYINAKVLMSYVLKKDSSYILINSLQELDKNQAEIYKEIVIKVSGGYPVQYITNKQEFMKLNFYVDENVLIPQPDTERLVEKAIEYCQNRPNCKVLDLCTGSGAIAISIKKYVPNANITGSDISEAALSIAKSNAKNNNVAINFIKSDMFQNINEKYDLIVSNPPYIKSSIIKELDLDVQKEPIIALDGGEDGIKFYKIIRENVLKYLEQEGTLMLEIGYDQKDDITNIFEGSKCIKDYNNKDRVVIWNHFQEK